MPSRECIVAPSRANNLQSNLQSNPPRGQSWHRAASSHHSELLARLRTRPGTFSHIIVPARAVCSSPRRVLSSLRSRPAGRDRGNFGLKFRPAPAHIGLQIDHKKRLSSKLERLISLTPTHSRRTVFCLAIVGHEESGFF